MFLTSMPTMVDEWILYKSRNEWAKYVHDFFLLSRDSGYDIWATVKTLYSYLCCNIFRESTEKTFADCLRIFLSGPGKVKILLYRETIDLTIAPDIRQVNREFFESDCLKLCFSGTVEGFHTLVAHFIAVDKDNIPQLAIVEDRDDPQKGVACVGSKAKEFTHLLKVSQLLIGSIVNGMTKK